MKVEVSNAIEELRRQFSAAAFTVREDGQGGAYVVMEPVTLGPKYRPEKTWVGFHIPPQYRTRTSTRSSWEVTYHVRMGCRSQSR